MVTRKPVPAVASISTPQPGQQQAAQNANPPYPTTPTLDRAGTDASADSVYSPDLKSSPAFDLIDMHEARQRKRSDSDDSSHGTWDSEDDDEDGDGDGDVEKHDGYHTPQDVEIPKPLQVRASADLSEKKDDLPAVLRPGGLEQSKPRRSLEAARYDTEAQANPWSELDKANGASSAPQPDVSNPFRQNGIAMDNSQSAWQETRPPPPPEPTVAPPPPPAAPPPAAPVIASEHSLDTRPASWSTVERISVPQQGQPPLAPVAEHHNEQDAMEQRPLSTWWQDPVPQQQDVLPEVVPPPQPTSYEPPNGPKPPVPIMNSAGPLIDHEEIPSQPPPPPPAAEPPANPANSSGLQPAFRAPPSVLGGQRNEHYQIKLVNWYDPSCVSDPRMRSGMRRSPILMQNANGPCPLLALVNALVLSTPYNVDTALVQTLQSREQVSLGLLLDAVFDELISGRRGDATHQLPDVGDLYSFLLALHTGMNVNPRFVTPTTTPRGSLDLHPSNLGGIHPLYRAQNKAGAFEETREMRLYSTFSIPLIHGWTPPAGSPAYEAFLRSAQSFEDAQNIQFAEAELNDKLAAEGLSQQEQQLLQDIQTIRAFLETWPTQLTDYGLDTMLRSLQQGQISILFRNDHFSTIYKEPQHGTLMTLVTDAGYSGHDEIVWESLVDVNGSMSEMFSGDFRAVSHHQDARIPQPVSNVGTGDWQTVQNRTRYRNGSTSAGQIVSPTPHTAQSDSRPWGDPSPSQEDEPATQPGISDDTDARRRAAEQEDHDLALALQLQEEEEDQHRQAAERRRREQELSEQFLSSESSEGPRPPIPPRRAVSRSNVPVTNSTTSRPTGGRAPVSRPTDSLDPDAPPSYEQAASDRIYHPPDAARVPPSPTQGNALGAYDALRRQQSAYSQQSTSNLTGGRNTPPGYSAALGGHSRRRSDANRLRRRSSQFGMPGGPAPLINSAGGVGAGGPPSPQRINGAMGVRDAEERCVVM